MLKRNFKVLYWISYWNISASLTPTQIKYSTHSGSEQVICIACTLAFLWLSAVTMQYQVTIQYNYWSSIHALHQVRGWHNARGYWAQNAHTIFTQQLMGCRICHKMETQHLLGGGRTTMHEGMKLLLQSLWSVFLAGFISIAVMLWCNLLP